MISVSKIKEIFGVEPINSVNMDLAIQNAFRIYTGNPSWIDYDEGIKTINFAKTICSETSRLTTLAIKITIDGGSKAEWIQEKIDELYTKIREWVEYGCAYGMIIMKPNSEGVDLFTPENYIVTKYSKRDITGVIFLYHKKVAEKYFTRLEYHNYVSEEEYEIVNRCFVGAYYNKLSEPVDIALTPWAGLQEEANIQGMKRPAYGVFRTPQANNIDVDSYVGVPLFHEAMEELEDLDVAYSRNVEELYDSRRVSLLDSDKMMQAGTKINDSQKNFESNRKIMKLPRFVKNVFGNGRDDFYQEINPTLNTGMRINGINAILNQIGYKIGFSNGYFVFKESSGIRTATEIEANQQRTIQFIKDVRDKLEHCMDGVIAGLNMFGSLFGITGDYEVVYSFGDITYNYDEDKKTWWGYVMSGKVPAWMYFVKFEGMTEEEARAMAEEMKPKQHTLFGSEE